ncbi:MAG: hypothetical protein ACM3JD_02250, partial [Rudaea sp.]
MNRLALAIVLLATFAAAQAMPPQASSAGIEQVLLQADRDFARDTAHLRLEGWMAYMADDALLFSSKPIVGKDAIRAY